MKNSPWVRGRILAIVMVATITGVAITKRHIFAAEAPATTQDPAVTWSRQIAPLVYNNCTTCHHPGGAGPFSLLTYQDALRWGPQIATVTSSRYMPPWLPEHGYGDFEDERRLSNEDIALIAKWVKTGLLEGDRGAAPPAPKYSETWQYGTPDLILTVERPFNLAASGTDVFRNFVLPYPLQQTHYIRATLARRGSFITRTFSSIARHRIVVCTLSSGRMAFQVWSLRWIPETSLTRMVTSSFGNRTRPCWLSRRACHGDLIPAMT